jgi:HAD superfamily hydrolase (TIGR01484 family)
MMLPLPPLARPQAVVSFDFDGTLHHPASDPPVPRALFDLLKRLRETRGLLWGINTGRSMEHMLEGFEESRFPFLPDWVVAREREIYLADGTGGWTPHQPWNERCEAEIHGLFRRARHLLDQIRHDIEQHTGAEWFETEGEPAGVVGRTEEEIEWIVQRITPVAAAEPELAWQRNTIWLRFGHRDFQKGSSLSEVARLHDLPVAARFAMGDSHNDLEMLDAAHCGMVACPANSVPEILAKVKARGGIITRGVHGEGAVEALASCFGMDPS